MVLTESAMSPKQARRQRKKAHRVKIDGIRVEAVQEYLDNHYVCDHCGRLQPSIHAEFKNDVFFSPCHEWNGISWIPSGCPGETALGASNFERHDPAVAS